MTTTQQLTRWGVGFDLDSTLVLPFTAAPYPQSVRLLEALKQRSNVSIFVASNQAGPVYRAMLDQPKYPDCEQLATQLLTAADRLGLFGVPWYISTWHGNRKIYESANETVLAWAKATGEICDMLKYEIARLAPPDARFFVHGSPHWRKPEWGMLDEAARLLNITPGAMSYVGDMTSDREAATSYGATFVDAAAWRSGEVQL